MPRIFYSSLALAGCVLVLAGLIVQRRAVMAHAKPGVPRGVSMDPRNWWPAWRFAGELDGAKGVRSYVVGLSLYDWGITMVAYALGYIVGHR